MRRIVCLLVFLAACSGRDEAPSRTESLPPEESSLVLQAVDAGTGGALADDSLTVRYLVRSPVTLDASAVQRVPATEPYEIRHAVGEDSLVVEVRLEAPAYHRVDTVLAVGRGRAAGPFTIRMARRLGRQAATDTRPAPTQGGARPEGGAAPAAPTSPPPTSPGPTDGVDRTAMRTGDRAFQRGDWTTARSAYQRMKKPDDRSGPYAREYQAALVRLGISHINLGEWGGAMEALEEAVGFPFPDPSARLRLSQAQCQVGLVDVGRQTLTELTRSSSIPAAERPTVLALAGYHDALCSQHEFETAEGTLDRLRTGTRAIKDFEAFAAEAQALSRPSPEVEAALADARQRAEEIREALRQAGRGGGGDLNSGLPKAYQEYEREPEASLESIGGVIMATTAQALNTIEADDLRNALRGDRSPVVVNALGRDAYKAKRIPGSINIPSDEVELAEQVIPAKDQPVVVYCANEDCDASPTAARKLQELGYREVKDFPAGLAGWRREGFSLVGEEA